MHRTQWGAILVILALLASLFGCSDNPSKYGDWQSLSLHRTSSVMTDAYHFTVHRTEDNGMTVTGFCYDEEREYRVEEPVVLPGNVAVTLLQMGLEQQPTSKQKSKPQMMDGAKETVSITHTNGKERQIVLSDETRDEIITSLNTALQSAVQSLSHGTWTTLHLYFRNDNASEGYDFELKQDVAGDWIASGYCSIYDDAEGRYKQYSSENGIVLDGATVDAICALGVERYPAAELFVPDPELEIILDGDTGGLTLGFSDGYTEEKATPRTLDNTVAELLKQEFAQKAEPQ